MLYIKHESRPILCRDFLSIGFEDNAWCYVNNDIGEKVLIGIVYRSPNSDDHNNDKLLELVKKATAVKNVNTLLLFGDFNFPEIDYETFSVVGDASSYPVKFFDLTQDLFPIQNVHEFTRIRHGQKPSKLDYVFTMDEQEVEGLSYLSPLGRSGHVGIQWKLNCNAASTHHSDTPKYAYWKADYHAMSQALQKVSWDHLEKENIENVWTFIRTKYQELVKTFVPTQKFRQKKSYHLLAKKQKNCYTREKDCTELIIIQKEILISKSIKLLGIKPMQLSEGRRKRRWKGNVTLLRLIRKLFINLLDQSKNYLMVISSNKSKWGFSWSP